MRQLQVGCVVLFTYRAQMRILLYIGIHIGLDADITADGYLATQPGGWLEVHIEQTRVSEYERQICRALRQTDDNDDEEQLLPLQS